MSSGEYHGFTGRIRISEKKGVRDRGSLQIPVDIVEFLGLKHRDFVKVMIKKLDNKKEVG